MRNISEKRRFGSIGCRVLIGIAAVAISACLFAEDKPVKKATDPLLADLKATGEAMWRPEYGQPMWLSENDWIAAVNMKPKAPMLRINVILQGTATKRLSAYGQLKLESVTDQDGKSYRWACTTYPGNGMRHFYRGDPPPQGGVYLMLEIPNRPPIKTIRELRGSLALQAGGEYQTVIVKDAFKDLKNPVRETNALGALPEIITPPGYAPPPPIVSPGNTGNELRGKAIRDKVLEAMGVKLATSRSLIPAWNMHQKIEDNIFIEVKSDDPVTSCDILASDGKQIQAISSSYSGNGRDWNFTLQTDTVIPPDAQLRLTFHKKSRKIRVPFDIKNIPVPEIKAGDEQLDVPASPDDVYVEAETVPAGDPRLEGVKFKAMAGWRPWAGNVNPPDLIVNVNMHGKTVDETSAYGEVEIESTLDESGKPIELWPSGFLLAQGGMANRFINVGGLAVEFKSTAARPVRKISELRGSLSLQAGGEFEIVSIKELLKKSNTGESIDDPALKALGITVKAKYIKNAGPQFAGGESLSVEVHWKRNAVVACEVYDEDGQPLPKGSWSVSNSASTNWWRSFKAPVPPNAELHLTVQKNSRKIRVPFAFKNMEVEPVQDVQDDGSEGSTVFPLPVPKK